MSNLFDKLSEDQLDSLIGALDTAANTVQGEQAPFDVGLVEWMAREAALAQIALIQRQEQLSARKPFIKQWSGRTEEGEVVYVHHVRHHDEKGLGHWRVLINDERVYVANISQTRNPNGHYLVKLANQRELMLPYKKDRLPTLDGKEFS